ncbi:hypothetical protein T492DRAFT_943643 [Pavlovales sp. CCMP2436]|nr:hypothetical protein T492DRAFT_943643 [Pavlovales sp. CCMP2436]|mmetsp:Transcript_13196/g.33498  ORF Transcript_13196/g.33498 Transcript_13196/m.33498 type:complete len:545 (+) Transcript_13196:48-1682(+)
MGGGLDSVQAELRRAVHELSDRGLNSSSKWAAEQLTGIGRRPAAAVPPAVAVAINEGEATDALLLARCYFQMREYMRASHVLEDAPGDKARFLRLYALYLAGERRKDDQTLEESSSLADSYPAHVNNPQLKAVEAELRELHERDQLDGYALYLYAVVLKQLQRTPQVLELLCAALHKEPTLWAAWLEVAAACPDRDAVARLSLPDHWMAHFFYAHVCLELQQNTEAVTLYERLSVTFPQSTYVLAQLATAHYQLREFDEAQARFEELLKADPYRLDHVDTYSNILYVKESKRALSYVAHNAVAVDKYRPETCCIVGNYYSLRAEHEKAVLYFQRALKLDRNYLSAWTLMGHEYVELKNTGAAIHAYRQAVEISPRDYRAWYALGQTYEILQMPFYALFYYRKATALRPYDARMWSALAGCYRLLNRRAEAIRCYERAESNDDREGIALQELARLHHELANDAQAATCYARNLARRDAQQLEGADTIEALKYLAEHCKRAGKLEKAQPFCARLLDCGRPQDVEEAKAMLREIRSAMQTRSVAPRK